MTSRLVDPARDKSRFCVEVKMRLTGTPVIPTFVTMGKTPFHQRSTARRRLTGGMILAVTLTMAVVVSGWKDDSSVGAPRLWPWLLTGLQVLALWSVGSKRWWGWPLGGSVQVPWIAYAVMTNQLGFIPGCAVSASVQIHSYLRSTRVEAGPSRRRPRVDPRMRQPEGATT